MLPWKNFSTNTCFMKSRCFFFFLSKIAIYKFSFLFIIIDQRKKVSSRHMQDTDVEFFFKKSRFFDFFWPPKVKKLRFFNFSNLRRSKIGKKQKILKIPARLTIGLELRNILVYYMWGWKNFWICEYRFWWLPLKKFLYSKKSQNKNHWKSVFFFINRVFLTYRLFLRVRNPIF